MPDVVPLEIHTGAEIDNFRNTELVLKNWLDTAWPSSIVIPEIHKRLLMGIDSYRSKGILERDPGQFRKEDIRVAREPENFYVRGTDVEPTMRQYFQTLDQILEQLPVRPDGHIEQIVRSAAWAYYAFERIHPFLDGNGRTGRIILNRILTGSGFKKIIFLDTWFDQEREIHLAAMNLSDRLGSIIPLELYLLHSLKRQIGNEYRIEEFDKLIKQKEQELESAAMNSDLGQIWLIFTNIDIASPREVSEFKLPALVA